jgi:hypothetical protein
MNDEGEMRRTREFIEEDASKIKHSKIYYKYAFEISIAVVSLDRFRRTYALPKNGVAVRRHEEIGHPDLVAIDEIIRRLRYKERATINDNDRNRRTMVHERNFQAIDEIKGCLFSSAY